MSLRTKLSMLRDQVFLREILDALILTFRHTRVKEVTLQYPHQKPQLPSTHRGALGLLKYENGQERCVGCDLCEAACPSHCIKVVSGEVQRDGVVVRVATAFDIDMTKCVFCGFCVEACPVNALGMTKLYEYSTANKRTLIFNKAKLYEVGERYYSDAKAYLVAHHQEDAGEKAQTYQYRFPSYLSQAAAPQSPLPKEAPDPDAKQVTA